MKKYEKDTSNPYSNLDSLLCGQDGQCRICHPCARLDSWLRRCVNTWQRRKRNAILQLPRLPLQRPLRRLPRQTRQLHQLQRPWQNSTLTIMITFPRWACTKWDRLTIFPGTINSLDIYTSAQLPNNFYPATYFPMYQELGKAALDFQYCADNIVNVLLTKLDSDWAYKYLNSYPDGENFSAGFRTVIYPSTAQRINTVQTIDRKTFKAPGSVGQWWIADRNNKM